MTPEVEEMVKKGFIDTRIHDELRALGYRGSLANGYRYLAQFKEAWQRPEKAIIRYETEPGLQTQYN
ncbi:MAG: hypothetical protein ACLQVJ_18640 [Syntrophobacteraceae bacterium]